MTEPAAQVCHLYVDEAGDTTIFDDKGRVNLGANGGSRYFMMGMLEVAEPGRLARSLTDLRLEFLADPAFRDKPSFDPKRKKTAIKFHAKDDLPAVRTRVFDLLMSFERSIRFRAIVSDKMVLLQDIRKKEAEDSNYRFRQTDIYDHLTELLFSKFTKTGTKFALSIASRGNKERSHAILTSVENAERNFQNALGFSRGGPEAWAVKVTTLEEEVCLQAVDYYLWALQKMYEKRTKSENGAYVREPRYFLELHNQISQIYDMHFNNGTYFRPSKPLTLASRFNGSIHSE